MTNSSTSFSNPVQRGPTLVPEDAETLAGRLVEEMIRRWGQGERPLAEEFLARHPELWRHPEAAADLIYEEVCLREQYGQQMPAAEVVKRFPQWRTQLEVLFNCRWLLEPPARPCHFPAPGELLGDFLLLVEIGRGGQGRVFLATQLSLANRPVVLKLTPCEAHEHLSLARLQHPFIVPLYSAQDYAERRLRALCMPYFGGGALAQLLTVMQGQPPAQRTGRDLLAALDRVQASTLIPFPTWGEARALLARASYVQAVCWIGTCLAEAVQFAHDRGLVHLDLKPSNVLVTADGLPMLLDFHLARAPLIRGGPPPFWFGGTAGYMSPEQQAVHAALEQGRGICLDVDGRSDIYSLGVVLYEALGGGLPNKRAVSLRQRNPQVSPGLADIVGKCLESDPHQRYADMAALAADLRRHLSDLPLRGVCNRSLGERWQKWRRRHPNGLALGSMLLVVLTAACAVLIALIGPLLQRSDQARSALRRGQMQLAVARYGEATSTFQHGLTLIRGVPFQRELTQDLERHAVLAEQRRAEAEQLKAAQELHLLVHSIRLLHTVPSPADPELRRLDACCRALWLQRDHILRRLGTLHQGEAEQQIRDDLLDLAILWADLLSRLPPAGATEERHRSALRVLNEAESLFGPSAALDEGRRLHSARTRQIDAAGLQNPGAGRKHLEERRPRR